MYSDHYTQVPLSVSLHGTQQHRLYYMYVLYLFMYVYVCTYMLCTNLDSFQWHWMLAVGEDMLPNK